MASIQPIEGGSVHRIQSGQVIVDLCSVVKELVENSLDAGATSIEVRFKNSGLDAIEVQDNGSGVTKDDYESIALKHYTSKLRNYEDLSNLNTFGFRGEALSSLCALSDVHILTATQDEAPKGSKLLFEQSGKLKSTQTVAAQRGTTVVVETIFRNLPVRRQELVKNIKREYGKVLGLLQAYACISTGVKVVVSNNTGKKKTVVFSTKPNQTTRENIANVFGAKTLSALVPLDLSFELQSNNRTSAQDDKSVQVLGHVSKPVVGEGRQTPDRQMFFVNTRPCALPQIAKVMNEVYKSYNISQSPFIFANVILDTNGYDVNVSPDKRTILLHEQGALLESIRESLTELFDKQQQTVPQSHRGSSKLPSYKPLSINREASTVSERTENERTPSSETEAPILTSDNQDSSISEADNPRHGLISQLFINKVQGRASDRSPEESEQDLTEGGLSVDKQKLVNKLTRARHQGQVDESDEAQESRVSKAILRGPSQRIDDFNMRLGLPGQQRPRQVSPSKSPSPSPSPSPGPEIPSISATPVKPTPGVVPNAFDRMRPMRTPKQTATITIGDKTTTSTIGSSALRMTRTSMTPVRQKILPAPKSTPAAFSNSLRAFAAPGSQLDDDIDQEDDESIARSTRSSTWGRSPSERLQGSSVERQEQDESITPFSRSSTRDQNMSLRRSREFSAQEDQTMEDAEDYEAAFAETEIPEVDPQPKALSEDDGDGEWLDEDSKKAREDAKVAKLIEEAEAKAALPSQDNVARAQKLLKGGHKDATLKLTQTINTSIEKIEQQLRQLDRAMKDVGDLSVANDGSQDPETAEERLSLTVSKDDFSRMRIVGQFNLGFILAVRPDKDNKDELFIIDQHASDEKFNFERLQDTTVVQNQRLVQPQSLELTAIEEELIMDNEPSLVRNGFLVSVDDSGDLPVGHRCKLTSLPMSREVTFSSRDLEELLVLLNDAKDARPSKVRKMFAMRACRSSVMVGKTLTEKQMERLVRNMGTIDKPWNCPHGRPTMRHLFGLGRWEGWEEGSGLAGMETGGEEVDWEGWMDGMQGQSQTQESQADDEEEGEDEDLNADVEKEVGE